MPSEFFGQYLLEKGVISREQYLEAIRRQESIDIPLCALVVSQGYLTADQLRRLEDAPDGAAAAVVEKAVREGLLTMAQLEELQRRPIQRGLVLGEALIRNGVLRPSRFAQVYSDYRARFPEAAGIASLLPPDMPSTRREVVEALASSFIDVFVHYTRQVVRVTGVAARAVIAETSPWAFSQHVRGAGDFQLVLALAEPLVLAIASEMFGAPVRSVGDAEIDALSEFLNVVSGTACARLGELGHPACVTGPPLRIQARDDASGSSPGSVVLNLETTSAALQFMILFAGAEGS